MEQKIINRERREGREGGREERKKGGRQDESWKEGS